MCGIVGFLQFGPTDHPLEQADVERMRDRLIHRGPDGSGYWMAANQQIAFGHRRLAIIDPGAAASQPMVSRGDRNAITFNGEIYNHQALREVLKSEGEVEWRTDHSDTEVLLRALDSKWLGALDQLRGMFAFAYWNEERQTLLLVRDRLGIKPLYYSIYEGRITFASEIKALLEDPALDRAVDDESLFHYLSFMATPAPKTLFKGIRKLPAGGYLCISREGKIQEGSYWDPWTNVHGRDGISPEDASRSVLDTLRDSVGIHALSDVPVGVFLSGGVDSSTNAALFSELHGEVRTFTVGYDSDYGTYANEFHHARDVADSLGADHHEQRLRAEDLVEFLPRMVYLQDEPLADPVCMPVYYVSRLAREHGVIVCQVGEGADELFWGYDSWKKKRMAQRLLRWLGPPIVPKTIFNLLSIVGLGNGHLAEAFRRAGSGQPIFWGGADAFTHRRKMAILGPKMREKFEGRTSWEALDPMWKRFQENAWEKSVLHWMTYVDLQLRLPELLLMRVDKMAMGVSLEGRVPFLDHVFVENALSLPEKIKTRQGKSKVVLKEAVRGLIPDHIIDRRKQGFGVPIKEWFVGALGDRVRDEIVAFAEETGLLDPDGVRQLHEGKKYGLLWHLYNFVLWHRMYIDQSVPLPELEKVARVA